MSSGTITGVFEIQKVQQEKRLVFGWGYVSKDASGGTMVDHSGEIIEVAEMEKAAYRFVELYRDGSDNHSRGGVAVLVESMMFTKEKQKALGIPPGTVPEGWYLGFKVTDDAVWDKIKKGEYRMMSIEGTARRVPITDI